MSSRLLSLPSHLVVQETQFSIALISKEHLPQWVTMEQEQHSHPWSESNIKDALDSYSCIGLWRENALVGYAVLSFVVGEGELLLFVLSSPWRGKGIASAFLRTVLKACVARVTTVFLEVRESNDSAICLYEACGFHQVGERKGYYPVKQGSGRKGRETALIYAKEL